jgi:hypothetical protein
MLDSLIHKPRPGLLELHETLPERPKYDIWRWEPDPETPAAPARTWGIMTIATSHPGSVRLVHSTRPTQTGEGYFTGWGPRVPGV